MWGYEIGSSDTVRSMTTSHRRTSIPGSVRAALFATALLAAAAGAARELQLEDLYRLQTVSDPQLSPDGRWVAYVVSTPSRERDADESDIWVVAWDGGTPRRLTYTAASEHSPRWSPDGRRLAFLSDRDEARTPAAENEQIWVMDLAGGEAQQRTHFEGAIGSFAWAPDGRRWAVSATLVVTAMPVAERPAPIVIDRLQFKRDVDGYLGAERAQLFLIDTASGAATALTSGPTEALQPNWSPDGRELVYLAKLGTKQGADPDAHDNWDVWVIEARAGGTRRQLTSNPGVDGDPLLDWGSGPPRFSADGSRIAYTAGGAPEELWYGLLQVGVIDAAPARTAATVGAAAPPTASLDRNTLDPRWSGDGRWLYFRLEDDRSMPLARVRLTDGRVERLTPAGTVASEFDVGRDGRAVIVATRVDQPGELMAVTPRGLRTLTRHNEAWLHEVTLAPARDLAFDNGAGQSIGAILIEPRGTRPVVGWPTLLRLHGGPVSQHQHEFDFAWQLFAARGYAVVAPNPRGSTGRGHAFQKALFAKWGEVDVVDVLAVTDGVVRSGLADPARLGVGGWSYGSILTNYVIASDTRFKAATSGAGISNMLAGYGTDQYLREYEVELGLPWENTELWLKLSYPFFRADRIRTPTLFMGGADDFNVPLQGSEQMYQALRRLGVPTQLVIYPGQHHAIDRPVLRADRLQRYLDWYARWLRD
jgi:dipeptidyl aminopeptidase/acylaminoacyl peptidase